MNAMDLVKQHEAWLMGDADKPDLRGVDLLDADLPYANLLDADLPYADLRYANLRGANLRDANLRGANLRDANLRRADLRDADLRGAIGYLHLTRTDHGHDVAAVWCDEEWRIQAGCRDFTISEARAHWGSPDYHTPRSGSRIVHMLDWLENQPTPEDDR